MKNKLVVGWSAFARWELELAHGKAKSLIGKYGFTKEDAEDIAQELLLVISRKRKAQKSWRKISASKETVMSRILDNRIRDLIKSLNTDKRRVCTASVSLSMEIDRPYDDETMTLEDLLGDDGMVRKHREPFSMSEAESKFDFLTMLSSLSDIQRRIIELRMEGYNASETARILGITRSGLNRRIARIRQLLAAKCRIK